MNGETGTGTLESVGVHLYLFAVPLTVKLVPQQIVRPSGPAASRVLIPIHSPFPAHHPVGHLHYYGLLCGTTYSIKMPRQAP